MANAMPKRSEWQEHAITQASHMPVHRHTVISNAIKSLRDQERKPLTAGQKAARNAKDENSSS